MFDFIIEEDKLLVTYYSNDGVDWVSDIIDRKGSCLLRRTFCLVEGDIKKLEDEFDDVIVFILGDIVGKYIKIRKDILDIDFMDNLRLKKRYVREFLTMYVELRNELTSYFTDLTQKLKEFL